MLNVGVRTLSLWERVPPEAAGEGLRWRKFGGAVTPHPPPRGTFSHREKECARRFVLV
jgi:hypothetical protein